MPVTAQNAAAYLARSAHWKLSNLQIHKILYLADMNFVGQTGSRLIDEFFEAWDYGPVVPSLYHSMKIFGAKPVTDIFWNSISITGSAEAKILDRALAALKEKSAGQLVENTHWSGGAWAKNYRPGARGIKIPTKDMIDEYRARTSPAESSTAA